MVRFRLILVLLFLGATHADGQEPLSVSRDAKSSAIHLTGNVRVDLFSRYDLSDGPHLSEQADQDMELPRKSPWLAAGLSLAVPGVGEAYSGSYVKAAAFFAAEVAAWVFAYSYDRKGDRQTDFFESYADMHWNVVEYAMYAEGLAQGGPYNWRRTGVPSTAPPWEQVNWAELNRMERSISEFSHTLPLHGEQQYYELIGKYYQFNQGWKDVTLIPGTPGQLNTYYEKERALADDFYGVASTAVNIVIINHVLSAADAAWSASTYNKIHAQVGMQTIPLGRDIARVPVLKMSYSF